MTNDENIRLTRSYITQALFSLMKENEYGSISISDIAKKAGVSRATFYRHFDTKDQIVKEYFVSETNTFLKSVTGKPESKDDFYEILFTAFSQLKQQKKIFQRLMDAHMEEIYLDYLNDMLKVNQSMNRPDSFTYLSECIAGSLYNLSLAWVRNDCKESVRYMADGFFKILDSFLRK